MVKTNKKTILTELREAFEIAVGTQYFAEPDFFENKQNNKKNGKRK